MYKKWDIVMLNFPFSDFKNFKLRPVLIWDDLWYDFIVMPITSSQINNFWEYFLPKDNKNNLKVDSYLKPFNINTIDKSIIVWKLWFVTEEKIIDISKLFCSKFCLKKG